MDDDPKTSGGLQGLRAGSRLGQYRLKRLIGKGGFGHVWEAEDTAMDRVVALKLLRSDYSDNEKFRQRLFREARAAGRLHDPHVVPIHQCGEIDGQLYIDMRLIEGTDLQPMLSRKGPLAPARAVAVVGQIAAALDAAHKAGLIHRDVKPANILLTEGDFACLVDFGLANAASDVTLTSSGTTIGTFAYMAPERLSAGGEIDHRADIYALTCVLYECLTGSPPYSGDLPALISAHLTAPIPEPGQRRPGIPAAFDDVIARGMAKKAEDRYASAGDLARAAEKALTNPDKDRADTAQSPTQAAVGPLHETVAAKPPPQAQPEAGTATARASTTKPRPQENRLLTPPRPTGWSRRQMAVALSLGSLLALVVLFVGRAIVRSNDHIAPPTTPTVTQFPTATTALTTTVTQSPTATTLMTPSPTTPIPAIEPPPQTRATPVRPTYPPAGALGSACPPPGGAIGTGPDGAIYYCSRIQYTDGYVWSLTRGDIPNPNITMTPYTPPPASEVNPVGPAPMDPCRSPGATTPGTLGLMECRQLVPGGGWFWGMMPG